MIFFLLTILCDANNHMWCVLCILVVVLSLFDYLLMYVSEESVNSYYLSAYWNFREAVTPSQPSDGQKLYPEFLRSTNR